MGRLILASASPRRAELLGQLGVEFEVCPVDVDESRAGDEAVRDYVSRVAALKAQAALTGSADDETILVADTAVAIGTRIFGKPADADDAREMLHCLSGRTHEVLTALVVSRRAQFHEALVVVTRVTFSVLDDEVIDAYWATGEPADKAGAYGIQGLGGVFVRSIEGSYSSVVGLPLAETAEVLNKAGIRTALVRAD
ncbi:MAG: Maf family protein [Gammaproteobacteria bacterium]